MICALVGQLWAGWSSDPCGQLMAWLGRGDLGCAHSHVRYLPNFTWGSGGALAMYLVTAGQSGLVYIAVDTGFP